MKTVRSFAATALAGVALLSIATSAFAQETGPSADATSEGDIVVTGSRIPRPSLDNAQPTITITADSFNARGYVNVAQALSETPGFGAPESSSIGSQGSGFGVGQSFANLYSLGSQRTLTLVNGRRFVGANPATIFSSASSGSQVDLNTIPTKLIDRIETIGIGGAPIYGSDAIAGTVNIILKKDFSGVDLDAQTGISQQGDLANHRVRALGGMNFDDGRGNVTASLEYNHADGLIGTEREAIARSRSFVPSSTFNPADPTSGPPLVLADNVRAFLGVPGGNPYFFDFGMLGPASIVNAAGQPVRFAPNGNLVAFDTGTPTPDPSTFIGGDNLNPASVTNLQVASSRYLANLDFHYALTDHVKFFAEGWYSKTKAANLVGQPIYNITTTGQPGVFNPDGNFIVKVGNPYLTPQAKALIVANLNANGFPATDADDFYVARANTDIATGRATLDQDLFRVVGGFEGDFSIGSRTFKWDVSGNYGRTKSVSIQPTIIESNLRRALNVTRDASGAIVCAPFAPNPADPSQPPLTPQYNGTISTTCAPLNIFGLGTPSQAARDYITANARTVSVTSQRDFVANLSGTAFTLPAGDVGVAIGYENRREYSRFTPDAVFANGLGRNIPVTGLAGSYTTNEAYGEVRVPLVAPQQDIPFIHALEVNASGRYVDNSHAGHAFTWSAGGRFAPVADLAIRGNYTRSIRAPGITELFAADQPAFDNRYDPCDRANRGAGPNPATRAANCSAVGLPANFVASTSPLFASIVGNQDLKNETADSWTAGAVLAPRNVPGFSVSADYISIHLKDAVTLSSAREVASACYDSANFTTNFYCSLIARDGAGQIAGLRVPYVNQGGRVYRAVQVAANYRVELPNRAAVSLGANYQHTVKEYATVSNTSGNTQLRGQIGHSIDRANVAVTYDSKNISWFNQVEYIGPAVFDATEPAGTRDVAGVGRYAVYNTSVTFKVDDRFDLRVNVDNVTNRGLPYPASGSLTQNVYYNGLVGRSFLVGAHVRY